MYKHLPALWLVAIFSLSGIAAGQTPAPTPSVPKAANASSPSTLAYRSAFEGYKPYTDDKLLNWKEVNDTTHEIGGWRAYAREASRAEGKAPAHDMATMPESKNGGSKP